MLFQQENEKEKGNFYKVRRIDIEAKTEGLHVDSEAPGKERKIKESQVKVFLNISKIYMIGRQKTSMKRRNKELLICSPITRTRFHVTNGI